MEQFWSTLIGGVCTLAGGIVSGILIYRMQQFEYTKKLNRVRNAIHVEIKELWGLYQSTIGIALELESEFDSAKKLYPNSSLLVELGEEEFVRKIIQFYCVLRDLSEKVIVFRSYPKKEYPSIEVAETAPVKYLINELRVKHDNFRKNTENLLGLFSKELSNSDACCQENFERITTPLSRKCFQCTIQLFFRGRGGCP